MATGALFPRPFADRRADSVGRLRAFAGFLARGLAFLAATAALAGFGFVFRVMDAFVEAFCGFGLAKIQSIAAVTSSTGAMPSTARSRFFSR